ncbi:MAG: class I SAM-dependent methyltransferase [Spirochaetales bacterium]|nr:class I SAM-dependent methyltransferase [Leptospiraceae bacterium]MCP5482034.1 class I SAM-dependent methyltransferase [Spirochaetales bacterium]MCP5486515.1 class I SAM-dependent methyltransferase [Spirochaetales bacterium]
MRLVPCDACGSMQLLSVLEKASSRGEVYQVSRCRDCSLVQVNPQPDLARVEPYYADEYFERRTDRGYANYYSENIKQEIRRVYNLNLNDLDFFDYERQLFGESWLVESLSGDPKLGRKHTPVALDVGCAAGYFVEYLRDRNWEARGVELSRKAAHFGLFELELDIIVGDFLNCNRLEAESYDLITLWASIEHMHSPRRVLEQAHHLLKPGGRMLLSTCRYGWLARMRGARWRYMNVPEHLYFFSLAGLKGLARQVGLQTVCSVTYGSGMTTRPDAGPLYRVAKRLADPLVKLTNQGDMMALHLIKA